ncbi:hypothetical protein BT63DRAFT_259631 [Microthyrium microscopicum]|uniref:Chitin biosynthesis protein n=1 Tax=Microthyrium microscopicum TaxID=703497 RepID=A0A6A6UBS7_9PEZI|nr:hypothetical protein BT63DRAFT_259631 [Microthyrium microscopicum]
MMLVSLTVGKVDAGMAVLLTDDKRIIEFPSILLPSNITTGSIVDITVARNHKTEDSVTKSFSALQSNILQTFGSRAPTPPTLRCRNATQTAVVLEWDTIDLATADLRSLSLFRNGSKAGTIPRPTELTATKISGLAVDTDYTFHLVLRTSAGTFSSPHLTVRTHKMEDLTGITVTPGIMPGSLRTSLAETLDRIGGKLSETVRIDTTHFICTEPRGAAWERAREMNIPVVVPDWLLGCESEQRIIGVRQYYLDADPRLRQVGPSVVTNQTQGQKSPEGERPRTPLGTPSTKITPPTPEQPHAPEVPPKDTPPMRNGGIAEEDEDKSEAEDKERKTSGVSREADDEDEDDDDVSSADVKSPTSEAGGQKVDLPVRGKPVTLEEEKEEKDTSFQDVAL